ncbi:MAG: endonuclease/exonuclease/phosphatase family protein [Elainella sp.]
MKSLFRVLLPWTIWAYLLLLLGCQIAQLTPLNQLWPLQLIITFKVWLYLPLVILIPFCLLYIRKRVALLLLITLLWFSWDYGWCLLPHWTIGPMPLRVMSWNIRYDNPSPEVIGQTILAQQPDVVALQALMNPNAQALAVLLQSRYPHQAFSTTAGLGIFSRYPLTPIQPSPAAIGSRYQQVTITPPEATETPRSALPQQFTLINVHLPTPSISISRLASIPIPTNFFTTKQNRHLAQLLQQMQTVSQPLLVMGDFNIGDRQPNYQRLRAQLGDAFYGVGWGLGLSYPVNRLPPFPLVRIDYLFHSSQWQPQRIWQGQRTGSDHKYLVAELRPAG